MSRIIIPRPTRHTHVVSISMINCPRASSCLDVATYLIGVMSYCAVGAFVDTFRVEYIPVDGISILSFRFVDISHQYETRHIDYRVL